MRGRRGSFKRVACTALQMLIVRTHNNGLSTQSRARYIKSPLAFRPPFSLPLLFSKNYLLKWPATYVRNATCILAWLYTEFRRRRRASSTTRTTIRERDVEPNEIWTICPVDEGEQGRILTWRLSLTERDMAVFRSHSATTGTITIRCTIR